MKKNKKIKLIKYKYFIKYINQDYVLEDLYRRKILSSMSFKNIYNCIRENNIKFEDVRIDIKTLNDFFNYATFVERTNRI